ncbi:MAG TPA: sigma-70 family RNA polymerase sigma factor [Kribbella sp.]|nr:sigma-70 family RNA polymerase sigma factor [Kribbella sp.]
MTVTDASGAVDAVWRIESARIVAGVARIVRDVGLAEELAQDALVAALEQWPESGVPKNPGAWLMAIAKRRAIDLIRRKETYQRKLAEMGHELEIDGDSVEDDVEAILEDHIEDDLLRLVFTACHPVLTMDARVTLTLKLLGGLKTDEIARAFLAPEATIAQRIVRAKRNLAKADVQFEVPSGPDLLERLQSVLEVVYLIYNEGYSATAGDDWMRPALCNEAMRLGRLLVELMPTEPEVLGLLALMELQSSRANARTGPDGEPVLLLEQDRRRWDRLLIRRGLEGIERAWALEKPPGPYLLQAAIAACHARAADPEDTDWPGSQACTPYSRRSRRRRWSNSTRRSRSRWRSAPNADCRPSTCSPTTRRCRTTTCSRASAATCCSSSAAWTRPAPSSRRPPRSPVTNGNANSSSNAPPPADRYLWRRAIQAAAPMPSATAPPTAAVAFGCRLPIAGRSFIVAGICFIASPA